MKRRQFVVACAATASLAGCVGGRGDSITMLAVNRHDAAHTVTAWVVRGERLRVAETVDVPPETVERLGEMAPDGGSGTEYRVTVLVDGDPALVRAFAPDEPFNQLDVVIGSDGTVELTRALAA